MGRRLSYAAAISLLFVAGLFWAYDASTLYTLREGGAATNTYELLFNSYGLLPLIMVLFGIYMGARSKGNHEEKIENGKILRHDEDMFIMHWCTALGTLTLIITGLGLGTLFFPRLVSEVERVGFLLNAHFIGMLFFLFGVSFYITKGLFTGELKTMMPKKGDLKGMLDHYVAMIKHQKMPQEEKILFAERVVFPAWIIAVSGITLTGVIKILEHFIDFPSAMVGFTTDLHGLFMVLFIFMLVAHVFAGAILPASWPLLKSMITGYVSEKYARTHHGKWIEKIEERDESSQTKVGKGA